LRFRIPATPAQVYEGVFRGARVAVKTVAVETEAQRAALAKEAALCGRFRHCERVVQLLAAAGLSRGGADSQAAGQAAAGEAGGGLEGGTWVGPASPHAVPPAAAHGPHTHTHAHTHSRGPAAPPRTAALVMELCQGGNLGSRIHAVSLRRLSYLEVLQVGALGVGARRLQGGRRQGVPRNSCCEIRRTSASTHKPPIPPAQVSRDVAEGLAALHRFGVLHRDLKVGSAKAGGRVRATCVRSSTWAPM
jgi:serine/threonine protein kinase